MSKKKPKQLDIVEAIEGHSEDEVKRLTPAEYWEWRCAIADMATARKEKELADAQLIAMRKEVEIASLKARLFELVQCDTAKTKVENSTKAYEDNKKHLEMVHQISLSGKIIDEVTYEIKELQV